MKDELYSIVISLISVIIFLISSFVCYLTINKKIDEAVMGNNISIFTFNNDSPFMNISSADMLAPSKSAIASTKTTLSASYRNELKNKLDFKVVMDHNAGYNKTKEIDGKTNLEYTYEVLKDGNVIVNETQFKSYEKGDQTILFKDTLKSGENSNYEIIFRFYAHKYNQSHLIGMKFDSTIKVIHD